MNKTIRTLPLHLVVACAVAQAMCVASPAAEMPLDAVSESARAILDECGTRGGLIVHVGCGDGELTAALHADNRTLVHGLDTDAANITKARTHIRSRGLCGEVSVDLFDGRRLPYADNLVNLLVAEDLGEVGMDEVMRVLAPLGAAYINQDGRWQKRAKPWPEAIDQWTHYLHGADGNPVAEDDVVKAPRQLQWTALPQWARHHDHMASLSALVSSKGRIFFICDEGPKASMLYPPKWRLTARDAFNGLLLWTRSIDHWLTHLQPLKSGPASLPRRLVTDGDLVFATLGIDAPVSALDAATGETAHCYEGTEGTREIILSEGTLFLVRDVPVRNFPARGGPENSTTSAITAVDPDQGTILWEKQGPVVTLTLAADPERVVFFTGQQVIAIGREDGSQLWASEKFAPAQGSKANWMSPNPPRLIVCDKAVVTASGTSMVAISASDGKVLWTADHPRSGYRSPKDLFLIDNLIWYGDTAGAPNTGRFFARDVMTGELKRSFDPDIDVIWLSHHRCHFSKATRNYILPARMGVEFVDIKTEKWQAHHWVRGGCVYGVMPANGLLYAPPHSCACYFEAKLNGFCALTSDAKQSNGSLEPRERLIKGPAYLELHAKGLDAKKPSVNSLKPMVDDESDWPVFRHDSSRSGSTPSVVPANLEPRWVTKIGGKLTQPVMAGGKIFVASTDRHTLHALHSGSGDPAWRFTAGGRIDSPPSIYRGLVLFGSRDGWIYCLRGTDGELAWRFRAFPGELLLMSHGRLESAWPVHGSVLIDNNEVHCVAGRSMFLDGGLRYLRLDPATGKMISETIMDEKDPVQGGTIQKYDSWLDMTTTLPDVLASDEENIYMRSLPFDKKGTRRRISHFPEQEEPAHLFSPVGFLDDNWFHRSYWTYARCFPGGWNGYCAAGRYNPSGRLIVVDDSTLYGFGRKPKYYRWTTSMEYRLFATEKKNEPRDIHAYDKYKAAQAVRFPRMILDRKLAPPHGPNAIPEKPYDCKWEDNRPPLHVTAMVSTGRHLFVAGPRDAFDEGEDYFRNAAAAYQEKERDARKQNRLWNGEEGAILFAVSKQDGTRIAEHALDAVPVFDGMIAAGGKLFVSLKSGDLICLDGNRTEEE